ncbi:zinc-dependent metalloprotease [soil metagenome]
MKQGSRAWPAVAAVLALAAVSGCARQTAAAGPTPGPAAQAGAGQDTAARPGAGAGQAAAKPYNRVITPAAETKEGLFKVHRIDDKLFFEIPRSELNRDILVVQRTAAGGTTSGFFGGGPTRVVEFEREGNRVLLRQKSYGIVADPTAAISQAVSALNFGPIITTFNIESWGPDSAAVIDATKLFTTNINEFASVPGLQTDRSFIQSFTALPENINVEATQTGNQPPPSGSGPGARPTTVTALTSWSFLKLPDDPMRPRLHDRRIGLGSIQHIDYSRPEHAATTRRYIRRYRLEKQNPSAELSDPVEPIVFYIDRATPEWLVPYVIQGVDDWEVAYREAGFTNAIEGRLAPSPAQDPDFSLLDARHSVIYWRPSDVANATGGQIVDPRTGEILKAEVNMYHNVQNLLRNWYFTQVSPLDARAQTLPLPDSLMGRLVQYVVAHEIGHAIGFPHNMKASAMYPTDSLRSESFLRRMGGHVSTLMDYSRFNYVAQPEDNIPVDLLVPGVGPYDKFAIMWQNKPIPGAATPDDEWRTLDQWSRMQDTIPWFRWQTSDATAPADELTEAVGDADAVRASSLGMRNLERVAGSLLRVAERPGQDYTLLSELYGNVVSQWGRYNSHVAAVIGGAETWERYGTGPRFEPLPEARQRDAMQYLNQTAFRVPAFLLNTVILRRIEQEGIISRIRGAQSSVLSSLLSSNRLNRLVEYEALAGPGGSAYTVAEFVGDLRSGVWTELSASNPRVDVYRRNLQRAYLEAADRTINPPAPPLGASAAAQAAATAARFSDGRALLRGELVSLRTAVQTATNRTNDAMTRLHLRDVVLQIDRILDPTD